MKKRSLAASCFPARGYTWNCSTRSPCLKTPSEAGAFPCQSARNPCNWDHTETNVPHIRRHFPCGAFLWEATSMCRTHTSFEKDHICPIDKCGLSRGDPYGTRTHVTAVKGRCLNHLTNGPGSGNLIRTDDIPGMNRVLYQLSYAAMCRSNSFPPEQPHYYRKFQGFCQGEFQTFFENFKNFLSVSSSKNVLRTSGPDPRESVGSNPVGGTS